MPIDSPVASPPSAFRRWLTRFAIGVGVLAALIAIAWLAVPPIVRGQLESRLTAALGRKTTIEAVGFNPFELRLNVRKLTVADAASGPPLLTLDELVADLSSASLWRLAPVFDALVLVRPALS